MSLYLKYVKTGRLSEAWLLNGNLRLVRLKHIIILTGFLFLLLEKARNQTLVSTLDLGEILHDTLNSNEYLHKAQVVLDDSGNDLYVLLGDKLISINVKASAIESIATFPFLKNDSVAKHYLLRAKDAIGILEVNNKSLEQIDFIKAFNFYVISCSTNKVDTIHFIEKAGFTLLDEELSKLVRFNLTENTLFISPKNGPIWTIKNGVLDYVSRSKVYPYQKFDPITGILYTIYEQDTVIENTRRHFHIIKTGEQIILDSRFDQFNSFEFPLFFIFDNKIYFSGKNAVVFNIKNRESLTLDKSFIVTNVFINGFYVYLRSENEVQIFSTN